MAAGQTVRLDYVRHGLMEPRREEKEHRIASAVHLPVPVCSPHPYRSLSFPAEGHTTLVIAAPPLHRWRCPRSLEGGTRKGGRTAGHPCGSPWRNPRGMKTSRNHAVVVWLSCQHIPLTLACNVELLFAGGKSGGGT